MMRDPEWFMEDEKGWKCLLCPRGCSFKSNSSTLGHCRVRGLKDGKPYLPGYGECVSLIVDPIEKKPLYHFLPGSSILSTGPAGCNLTCDFCQNWSISQIRSVPTRYISPDDLAVMSMTGKSRGIAFTYTEPTIWFEYIADSAPLVRSRGGVVVMVSNGEINLDPLLQLIEITDAWNIDLKSWSDDFYKRLCGGRRDTVLQTIKTLAASSCHLEITFLIIPEENDDPVEWKEMAQWISGECGADTVLHISRYFPRYKLRQESTGIETLLKAREIFSEKLHHVYIGNVSLEKSNTFCSSCGALCIERSAWFVSTEGMLNGKCVSCGHVLSIVHEI
ncbi:MAG: AmmeMemoRadiSam system radical SAM enzyme [Candidatus Aegiribacteria sp.]|nr:AmmeMemoRadiSam system radical SAM enzyme [Candidatus Aegiribacteria sp.]